MMQVRWRGGLNASRLAAAKALSPCHEVREQELSAGDYQMDYDQDLLGEAEDPCEEAVGQAKQVALATAAAEKKESEAAKKEEDVRVEKMTGAQLTL